MGKESKIEWCDHTFNPWIGCTHVSEGCRNCYAETLMDKRWGKVQWGPGKPRVRTNLANWGKPLQWNREAGKTGTRPRVFCASLADWLDPEVPIGWLADLLGLIRQTPHLDWLLLTKRPENWRERIDMALVQSRQYESAACRMLHLWINGVAPQNVCLGNTVENQKNANERIPELLNIPARVRFLSCEPLLGPVDLGLKLNGDFPWESRWIRLTQPVWADLPFLNRGELVAAPGVYRAQSNKLGALSVETPGGMLGVKPSEFEVLGGIDWVICGGESGPDARPMHQDWARSLRDQCEAAGVPFFMKQMGGKRKPFPPIPGDLMVREFPEVSA